MEGNVLVSHLIRRLNHWHWRHRKVSAKENCKKILKVSHFCLGFSPAEKPN